MAVFDKTKPIFQPPKFSSLAEERQHRRQRLAVAFRLFARFGFDCGLAGHITVRDPEYPDCFWVNPLAVHFSSIRAGDLILVDRHGEIIEGKKSINQAAFAIHSQIHAARPDVVAIAHAHSIYGRTWSSLGRLLDPISQDACAFYEDHSLFDDYTGVVLDTEEGKKIARVLSSHKAVILRNHGLLTVGRSVDEAAWWFITMESCCQSQLMAESVGKPISIDPKTARLTHSQVGSHELGWLSFQPLYQTIVEEEPDCLEM